MNIAYVDRDLKNANTSVTPADKVGSPNKLVCGVGTWRYVIPYCSYVRMTPGYVSDIQRNFIEAQDLLFVNMHDGSDFVSVIREINPQAKIVSMPDRRLDETVKHGDSFWRELKSADLVAVRTLHDMAYYVSMLKTPVTWIPSPIGPDEFILEAIKETPRPEIPTYILAVGHRDMPHSYDTMQALEIAQSYSGLPIVIINPSVEMYRTAVRMNLNFEAFERCSYRRMLQLIRNCAFGIDIMPVSSNHRHAMTHGVLGVPLLVNETSNMRSVFTSVVPDYGMTGSVLGFTSLMIQNDVFREDKEISEKTIEEFGFFSSRYRIQLVINSVMNR